MDETLFKRFLREHSEYPEEEIVERELANKVERLAKNPAITIISGIRRCGKSTLLKSLRNKPQSYYVNFDDERLIRFQVEDFQKMLELLQELFGERDTFFFDEIQNIKGWERFVRRLHDSKKKIYVTGSNATMLSKELGTHLTGRHIMLQLFPFSFKEFFRFKKQEIPETDKLTTKQETKLKRMFNEYLEKGGFPEYLKNSDKEYLKDLYEAIIYRDIIARYKINERALKEVAFFTASNIGKEISFNQLRKLTNLTSATTIKEYFEYLESSYLVFLVPRYDPSLKKQIYANKKAYFIDVALASTIGFRDSKDRGRMLENIVFLQLKRNNLEVFYHRDKKECDFIVRKGTKIVEALQVTQTIENKKTLEREMQGLLEALKKYKLNEGTILTEYGEKEIKVKNKKIIAKPIWKWLLEQPGY